MAYTGDWFGPRPATGLAVSQDLRAWNEVPGNPITTIDERHYTASSRGQRPLPHAGAPRLGADNAAHGLPVPPRLKPTQETS